MSNVNPPAAEPSSSGQDDRPVVYVAKKSAKVLFASTTLYLEAFVVLFATLAMYALRDVGSGMPDSVEPLPGSVIWAAGGLVSIILMVLGRRSGKPGGYTAGSVMQVVVLASGFLIPMMFLVGAIFAVMWFLALRLGGRVDRERAEYDSTHPETAPTK